MKTRTQDAHRYTVLLDDGSGRNNGHLFGTY